MTKIRCITAGSAPIGEAKAGLALCGRRRPPRPTTGHLDFKPDSGCDALLKSFFLPVHNFLLFRFRPSSFILYTASLRGCWNSGTPGDTLGELSRRTTPLFIHSFFYYISSLIRTRTEPAHSLKARLPRIFVSPPVYPLELQKTIPTRFWYKV